MKMFICFIIACSAVQAWAMKPVKGYLATPESLGLSFDSLDIYTRDSLLLKGWKMSPAPVYDRKTTIIIACGDAGNMSFELRKAYALVMNGFTVITFDYRGFGLSAPFEIDEKFLYYNEFSEDLAAVIKWARASQAGQRVGVLGLSMGTIISVMAAQSEKPDFLILEGLLYQPAAVAARVKQYKNKEALVPANASQISPLYAAISCKMLVIAGTLDVITPLQDSKTVVKQAQGRKLVKFKGDHLEGFDYLTKKEYGDEYVKLLIKFLE